MKIERSSGLLLHITSLPGKYGIGTLGNEAYQFVDLLSNTGQKYWQVLPFGPVNPAMGHSPYSSSSTFAGNYLFICPEKLAQESWFDGELPEVNFKDDHFINFEKVITHKKNLLQLAHDKFKKNADAQEKEKYDQFCTNSNDWLEDFALFAALSEKYKTESWLAWEKEISFRTTNSLIKCKNEYRDQVEFYKFKQYIFFKQWNELKNYCNSKNIKIIGDIPIYISMESSDAWAHSDMLQLNKHSKKPIDVSGVPPDYFSETGQRWGNPLYKWDKKTFSWWVKRIKHINHLVDIIRIDHFRAFESYWSIPETEKTAINGKWIKGPGISFFNKLKDKLGDLPLIAEDLGVITPEVEKLRDDLNLPGMKILQFAFDHNNKNFYLPHNIKNPNCLLYTGTHDNNTTNGWYYGKEIDHNTKKYILNYMGADNYDDFHWKFIKEAYKTIANLVIIPVQDLIGYGSEFRMNTPGTSNGNWGWKLTQNCLTEDIIEKLKETVWMYNR